MAYQCDVCGTENNTVAPGDWGDGTELRCTACAQAGSSPAAGGYTGPTKEAIGDALRRALVDLNDGELNNGCKEIRRVLRMLGQGEPDLPF